MEVILGIDIGGSTTKIVGLRTDGSVVSMLRVRAEDQITSLYGALGNYLTSNGLSLGDVRRVVLTGVGASYVDGDVFGLPTCRVDEFQASGTGALALSGQGSAVVSRWVPALPFCGRKPEKKCGTFAAAVSAAARWVASAASWWVWNASTRSKSWPLREI